jgi:hypothetical protein
MDPNIRINGFISGILTQNGSTGFSNVAISTQTPAREKENDTAKRLMIIEKTAAKIGNMKVKLINPRLIAANIARSTFTPELLSLAC